MRTRVGRPQRQSIGPFVGVLGGGAAPIPTISCDGIGGTPTSYLYDPFDDIRGWWNNSVIASPSGGDMRPVADTGSVDVTCLITSKNPVGSEIVTAISNHRFRYNTGFTFGGELGFGSTAPTLRSGVGFYSGSIQYWVTTSANSPPASVVYSEAFPGSSLEIYNYQLRMEVTPTQVLCYLNGVLKYTHGSTVNLSTQFPMIRVSKTLGGTSQFNYCEDFVLYGYDLPVDC